MNLKVLAAAIVVLFAASAVAVVYFLDNVNPQTAVNVHGAADNQYTISFDSNGGSEVKPQTSLYNYYISLPSDASKNNHILTGWNTEGNGKGVGYQPGSLYLVQGNITLYAVWTPIDKYYDIAIPSEAYSGIEYTFSPDTGDSQTAMINCIRGGFSSTEKGCYSWQMFYYYDWSIRAFSYELSGTATSWLKCDFIKTGGSGKTYITGLTFSGIPTSPGVYSVEFIGKESSDIVIHYKWYITVTDASCGRYQVSFDINGGAGSPVPSRLAQYNNLVTLPGHEHSLPSRTGYTLAGWQDPNGAVWPLGAMYPVNYNAIMKAYWIGNANVVVFDVSGSFASSGSSAYAVYTGSSIKMPDYSSLTKTGYELLGWYDSVNREQIYNRNYEVSSVSGDRLFAAYFVPEGTETCSVTYNANGGTCVIDTQSQQLEREKYAVLPAIGYNKENSTLVSWNTKADGSGTSYALGSAVQIIEDTTLYAQWHEESSGSEDTYYYVYFALNGGIGNIQRQYVLSGESAVNPSLKPVKAGSIFMGWSVSGKESDLYDFTTPVMGSITLTAIWSNHFTLRISDQTVILTLAVDNAIKHTIYWGDSSASEEINDGRQMISHDIRGGTASQVTVRTVFSDNTTAESSRNYYIPLVSEENKITIIFQAAEGNGTQEHIVTKGSIITLPISGFSRDNYVLAGWGLNQQKEVTHELGSSYTAEHDVTFFTIWKEETSDVFAWYAYPAVGLIIIAAGAAVWLKTHSRYPLAAVAAGAAVVIISVYSGGAL